MLKKILLVPGMFLMSHFCFSQNGEPTTAKTLNVQYEIMVIPYTKDGEDVRTVLDDRPSVRIAIAKVMEAFSKRGFKPKDFLTTLKAAKDKKIFNSNNLSDIKTELINFSGADIFVETDLTAHTESGFLSLSIPLKANHTSTGQSLSNVVAESGAWKTSDTSLLASAAIEKVADQFLDQMNEQFALIVQNGRSVTIDIGLLETGKYDMRSEIGNSNMPLSGLIKEWLTKNAAQSYYKLQGSTKLTMNFSDVHIAFKDDPDQFGFLLNKYLKSLGLASDYDIKGNSIYITIKQPKQ